MRYYTPALELKSNTNRPQMKLWRTSLQRTRYGFVYITREQVCMASCPECACARLRVRTGACWRSSGLHPQAFRTSWEHYTLERGSFSREEVWGRGARRPGEDIRK